MDTDSDEHLVRYLLGELPDGEAERLDERSIADDAFALRLRQVENDLVDRYVRGQLTGELLGRVTRTYGGSPHLREKVRFAEALEQVGRPTARPSAPAARGSGRIWAPALAAAAVLLTMATGYFGVSSTRLRDEVRQLDSRRAGAEEQAAELQRELERVRAAAPAIPPLAATVLLRPPRRGLDTDAPVVTIARGTSEVVLRLVVETDAYARFWAAVTDSAASRAVWRSRDLSPDSDATGRIVTVNLPASSLDAGRYVVDLFAMTPDGQGELIGQYPVRVVLE